ncbi:hypothetical protein RWE15_01260 [Virgibacillus halophilus]|uniref:Uncharacterized protein n=1 Tax=Tigheibacillus halophilus TaxID=361280 RepID=A0ABU5C249_9BACI|nr:hypothetical protein [Virgibacillus halophilus]
MSTTFVYKQTDDCQMKGELYPASNENAPPVSLYPRWRIDLGNKRRHEKGANQDV